MTLLRPDHREEMELRLADAERHCMNLGVLAEELERCAMEAGAALHHLRVARDRGLPSADAARETLLGVGRLSAVAQLIQREARPLVQHAAVLPIGEE